MDKIRCVKGRLELVNSINPGQIALKDSHLCLQNLQFKPYIQNAL